MGIRSYYNFDRLFSYQCVYNFLVGARGIGKSYGAKLRAMRRAIKTGDQFIYLRRYKEELSTAKQTFLADISGELKGYDFRMVGNALQWARDDTRHMKNSERPWAVAGYFMALSTAQHQKSVAFPLVKLIIFDEFIIEKGNIHYLPDEAKVFNNFFLTVDRYKDKTTVLFLANSVSMMNPYFIEYKIRPDESGEFLQLADGFILVHFPDSKKFKNEVYETRFGRFISGTDYENYAVGNQFADANDNMLGVKNSDANYMYSIETKSGIFSVWKSWQSKEFYIQAKRPKQETLFTIVPDRMHHDRVFLKSNDMQLSVLRTAWRYGRVSFDSPVSRNIFSEVFV